MRFRPRVIRGAVTLYAMPAGSIVRLDVAGNTALAVKSADGHWCIDTTSPHNERGNACA